MCCAHRRVGRLVFLEAAGLVGRPLPLLEEALSLPLGDADNALALSICFPHDGGEGAQRLSVLTLRQGGSFTEEGNALELYTFGEGVFLDLGHSCGDVDALEALAEVEATRGDDLDLAG